MCAMNPRLLRPLATGFNPRQIAGLRYWLDASDSSTITIETGVSEWRDKSGNGFDFVQPDTSKQPAYSDTFNGRNVVTVDGSNDDLTITGVSNTSGSDATGGALFVAFRLNAADTSYSVLYQGGASLHRDVFASKIYAGHLRDTRLEGVADNALPTSAGVAAVYSHVVNNAADSHSMRVDGLEKHSTTSDHTNWRARTGQSYFLGRGPASDRWEGYVCEIIEYGTALTAAQVSKVEGYLAWRWGLEGQLPTNHPYAYSFPGLGSQPRPSNSEALDWISRVYANGGTVSTSTANAVDTFCNAIDAAGIRDRFYRLNLFAGTGLNAALVPLYRGPSLAGTQYGNTTDTNNGPFVSGDYAETGASGGLLANGTSKYLDTGLSSDDYLANSRSGHLSAYHSQPTGTNVQRAFLGANNSGNFRRFYIVSNIFSASSVQGFFGSNITATESGLGNQVGAGAGHRLVARTAADEVTMYLDATSLVTTATNMSATDDVIADDFYVGARNNNGSADYFNNGRSLAYSAGLGMTAQQVADFYAAMQAFQAALDRDL